MDTTVNSVQSSPNGAPTVMPMVAELCRRLESRRHHDNTVLHAWCGLPCLGAAKA